MSIGALGTLSSPLTADYVNSAAPTPTPSPTSTPLPTVTHTPSVPPVLGSVWPETGLPTGGMPVSLLGSHFGGALTVTLNGALVSFTVVDDGRIDIVMPAGTAGQTVDFTVETPNGSSTILDAFIYVAAESGSVDGGAGGQITTTSGTTVTVPPQSIGSVLLITYTSAPPPAAPLGNLLLHSFVLSATLDGVSLPGVTNALTIELPVDPNVVPLDEQPWLYEWTESAGGRWALVPNQQYDPATRRVTVQLNRMGRYALSTLILQRWWFPVVRLSMTVAE